MIRLAAIGVVVACLLVASAHAATPTFAQAWTDAYNLGAIAHRSPYFITHLACKNAADGSHVCHATVWGVGKGFGCERLVIARSMAAKSSRHEACGPAAALWWSAPEGISRRHRA